MEEIEEITNNYYQSIILLHEKKEIEKSLPNTEFNGFEEIIEGLIIKLENEIKNISQKRTEFSEIEFKELVLPEIEQLKEKITLCVERKKKVKEKEKDEIELSQKADMQMQKHIIYATTPRGNICLEEDIKDIPKEFYERILKCIEKLENNIQEGNTEKERVFNNNAKLADICEKKEFKIRVYYKILTPETVYVMLAKIKKTDNGLQDRKEIINRNNLTIDEFEILKEEMKDESKKQQIIERNKMVNERIHQALSKRGEKSHE